MCYTIEVALSVKHVTVTFAAPIYVKKKKKKCSCKNLEIDFVRAIPIERLSLSDYMGLGGC